MSSTLAPPLTRSSTVPAPSPRHRLAPSDPGLLAPEDAVYAVAPLRRQSPAVSKLQRDLRMTNGSGTGSGSDARSRSRRNKTRDTSVSRRRKVIWKKLLWVKQSYPDNYTDQETFLEHLQRNPRLQPYDFWPLVADSTVIVQHVCSVIIFVVCFVGIFQERVSPVAVVSCGTLCTVLGWVFWDRWVGQEEAEAQRIGYVDDHLGPSPVFSDKGGSSPSGLHSPRPSHSPSATSLYSQLSTNGPSSNENGQAFPTFNHVPSASKSSFSPRNQQRLATAKSSMLIFCALLGLSPILKSLTKSTSSDSIWAISCWLMVINVFFFDYGSGAGVKFPASLSTNAALMASTVLASRLPSTEHVFSLTLFSIEVFGLFPVFRRHLRHVSWKGHLALTVVLIGCAGGGMGVVVSGGGWKAAIVGMTLGNIVTCFAMGGCSWWLIGLQKYKNEIHGPWDPARPVIRRRWEDY